MAGVIVSFQPCIPTPADLYAFFLVMSPGGFDRVSSLLRTRSAKWALVIAFGMLATLLVLTYQSGGVDSDVVIRSGTPVTQVAVVVPKVEAPKVCRTTCVKSVDGKLFEFAQFRAPEEFPIPKCAVKELVVPSVNGTTAVQKVEKLLEACAAWCVRPLSSSSSDATVAPSLTELVGAPHESPSVEHCPLEVMASRPMPPEGGKHVYVQKKQQWVHWENLADHCNDQHVLDRTIYNELNGKTLHIVYFTWLPANQNPRKIIPAQMKDVIASGLFDRPNTKLYIVVSTELDAEYDWFINQDWVKKYKPEMVRSRKNQHEFAPTRFLWELGCKHTDDLFLYFHSKGARYGRGRIGMEVILTREIVVNWRLMLNLVAAHPSSLTFGLGGPGWQWMNFFFARGSLFLTVPKPVPVENRYWYEDWIGYDRRERHLDRSPTSVSMCAEATGMEAALQEATVPQPGGTREGRDPQYGILRCGQAMTEWYQLDMWSIPAAKRMDDFLGLMARINAATTSK